MTFFVKRQQPATFAVLFGLFALPLQAAGEADRRIFAANVVDRDGNQVLGLTAANFRGEFRGQRVRILSVASDTAPRRIAVVVDTSTSMGDPDGALAFAWSAAEDLVDSLTPAQRVALFTLGETLHQHSQLTNDQRALHGTILQARAQGPSGPSALYDGVLRAVQGLTVPSFGDVVCLVSDGMDTSSRLQDSQVEIAVARTGVRVFVVRLPIADLEKLSVARSQAEFWTRSTAEATGGVVFRANQGGNAEARKKLRLFQSLITRVYRLEVAFPLVPDKPRKWTLEVTDASGQRLKNVELVYPRLLVPSSDK